MLTDVTLRDHLKGRTGYMMKNVATLKGQTYLDVGREAEGPTVPEALSPGTLNAWQIFDATLSAA